MNLAVWLLVLLVPAVLLLPQLGRALGWRRGLLAGSGLLVLWAGGWLFLERSRATNHTVNRSRIASVTSDTCFKCHEGHYATWRQTYHRTMTREATPEYVKGDFGNVTFTFQGVASRLTHQGDTFYMETADPLWFERALQSGKPLDELGPVPLKKITVDRLVGSHWFQECLHKDADGRYVRLPLSYHLVEGRWVHTINAFLSPDTNDFWSKSAVWNETCLFCHNTTPSKWPLPPLGPGGTPGYRTEVAELGIACEACHGPGEEHVRVNQNPARRLAVRQAGRGDPTIVHPRRLSVELADHICAHCHGATAPRPEAWDPRTVQDPYRAGDDLRASYFFFWSEREQAELYARRPSRKPGFSAQAVVRETTSAPGTFSLPDGRFWGDGTPLTTALEYQGMALSACYENGQGRLSCLSCHTLHGSDPNFMLGRGMDTNEACYQCHDGYRHRLAEHTHHAADSAGSLCYNCHMPYQVYSLLTGHRSHRIAVPRVKDSLGTGKPHACNLCHLDKSLAWTQDRLGQWYGHKPEAMSEVDRHHASSLVHLCQSDARSRVVVAHAFSWPAAWQASGVDWPGLVLPRILEQERYPAVRYLAYRGLRRLYGEEAGAYDYQAGPSERAARLRSLRARLDERCRPSAEKYPDLPLTQAGRMDDSRLQLLLRGRNDPDVCINE
jgi:predicted CXXCH cytochrome family protein